MTEDGYQGTDDLSTQKAGAGSKQTQSGQIVDLAEILSKMSSRRVVKAFAFNPTAGHDIFYLPYFPILGADNRIAYFGNTSVSFSDGLTQEVEWNETYRTDQSSLLVGQYAIDYDDGTVAYNSSTSGSVVVELAISELVMETPEYMILEDVDGTITYYGYAKPGSSTNDPVWKIKRLDETGDLKVLWADGDTNFDNVWDNRAGLSYS